MKLFSLSLLTFFCLSAQIQHLATDGFGLRVAFVTKLDLRSAGPTFDEKIYQAGEHGISMLLQRDRTGSTPEDTNYYMLVEPEWTSDGSMMAFTGMRNCQPPTPFDSSYCAYAQRSSGWTLRNGAETQIAPGHLRISADGKWGVTFGPIFYHNDPILRNLVTGESQFVRALNPLAAPSGRRILSADGTLVLRTSEGIVVQRGFKERLIIHPALPPNWAIVSNDGRHIYYETIEDAPSIRHYNLDAATDEPMVEAIEGCRQPALSDDGHTLVFLSGANWEARNVTLTPQAWAMDLRSGSLAQLTTSDSPIREVTLSGNGLTAWALTEAQTILRIDMLSREIRPVVAGQPVIDVPGRPQDLAPGSRYEFPGLGVNTGVLSLAGVTLEPVERTGERITVVLPWDLPTGETTASLDDPDSPFTPAALYTRVLPAAPRFWRKSPEDMRIVSAWRVIGETLAVITPEAPAEPGDLVEFQMIGLGPLDDAGRSVNDIRWEDRTNTPIEFVSAVRLDDATYRVRLRLPADLAAMAYIYARATQPEAPPGDYGWLPVSIP